MWNSRTDNIFGGKNKHAGRYLSARKYECYVLPKNSWKKKVIQADSIWSRWCKWDRLWFTQMSAFLGFRRSDATVKYNMKWSNKDGYFAWEEIKEKKKQIYLGMFNGIFWYFDNVIRQRFPVAFAIFVIQCVCVCVCANLCGENILLGWRTLAQTLTARLTECSHVLI